MKRLAAAFSVLGLAFLVGCLDQAGTGTSAYKGPLLRLRFAGRAHLPVGTNAAVYREIDALPATAEFRADVAQKLAVATLPFWRNDLPPGATDQSALLRPLLDDFLQAESLVEVRGPVGRTMSVLAVELSDDRAQDWNLKLRQVAAAWRLGAPHELTLEGYKGWEIKRTQAPNTLQFFRAGSWIVLGLGQDGVPPLRSLLQEARKSGRPAATLSTNFLELSLDLPGLHGWFPILGRFPLPAMVLGMSGRGEQIRTEGRFYYASPIPWKPEPWKIPAGSISEPLTSFTAVQGVAPLLRAVKGLGDAGVTPIPNQYCTWGIRHSQCRIYFGVPVAEDSIALMNKVALKFPQFVLSAIDHPRGDFFYASNRNELVWANLQHVIPILHPFKEGSDNWLIGGDFPFTGKHTPAPEALYNQVRGRTNLVYYDWELTSERLPHASQFYQLASLATSRTLPVLDTPSQKWIGAIQPKLGNTVTEITRVGPQELAMVRKSHLGLTGFEIASLAIWVDSPGFPLEFHLPPLFPWVGRPVTNHNVSASSPRTNRPVIRAVPFQATNPVPALKR